MNSDQEVYLLKAILNAVDYDPASEHFEGVEVPVSKRANHHVWIALEWEQKLGDKELQRLLRSLKKQKLITFDQEVVALTPKGHKLVTSW